MKRGKLTILLYILLLVGCNSGATINKNQISVTIEPLKYFVERISGNDFKIDVIVPPGASIESYEPLPSNLRNFEKSALFIYTGALESEFNIIKRAQTEQNRKLLDLSTNIKLLEHDCHGHHHYNHAHTTLDPHFWSSPSIVKEFSKKITSELIALKPEKSSEYSKNLEIFTTEIDSLIKYTQKSLESKKGGKFLIYHPSLSYYCLEFGVEQIAIESDGKESSAAHLKEVINLSNGRKYILHQQQFDKNSVEAVKREIEGEILTIDPLSYQWLDNMYLITDAVTKATEK